MKQIVLKTKLLELDLLIMIKNKYSIESKDKNLEDLDDVCEECREKHNSVSQNLILIGYKICNSCKISKTIFPI